MVEHIYKTISTTTVYRGRILALRADDVLMPGGKTSTREVVEHFGAVAVAAIDADRRVALVFQYRHPLGRRIWELPAGLMDVDGEDPPTTAARELNEEAGLIASEWRVLVDAASSPGFTDESVRVYLATGITHVGRPDGHDEEADLTVHWFDIEAATKMVLCGEIVNAVTAVGILAAHAATVGGQPLRPIDAPWRDNPTAFRQRRDQRGQSPAV